MNNKEVLIYEQIGGTYTEKDGLLYPNITVEQKAESVNVGKYGRLWIAYLKENHTDRYFHLVRVGKIQSKAFEVNEEAYEMLDTMVKQYLSKNKSTDPNSTMENWKLRERAKQIAEEVVLKEIVYRYH